MMTSAIHTRISRRLLLLSLLVLGLLLDVSLALSQRPTISRRDALVGSTSAAVALLTSSPPVAKAAFIDPELAKVTSKVYLDVEFGSNKGRIVMGLFGDAMPRVTENFVVLCKSNQYAGTTFYRVISDITVQGGAIGDATGKTGRSSFDGKSSFEPDNYDIQHSREGMVSMVRSLDGSVDSRFFINTAQDAGWADDRYAAFGIVQEGMDLVHAMEKQKVKPPQNKPVDPISIVASGVL